MMSGQKTQISRKHMSKPNMQATFKLRIVPKTLNQKKIDENKDPLLSLFKDESLCQAWATHVKIINATVRCILLFLVAFVQDMLA